MPEQSMRVRLNSRLDASRYGGASPEFRVTINPMVAGAASNFVFTAPARCRVVECTEVHDVAGAGASKIPIRKHVAGQTAAANAATSGTNIVDLVVNGIAADTTARVPQTVAITAANASLAVGDKLAVTVPATWVGVVDLYLVWL